MSLTALEMIISSPPSLEMVSLTTRMQSASRPLNGLGVSLFLSASLEIRPSNERLQDHLGLGLHPENGEHCAGVNGSMRFRFSDALTYPDIKVVSSIRNTRGGDIGQAEV